MLYLVGVARVHIRECGVEAIKAMAGAAHRSVSFWGRYATDLHKGMQPIAVLAPNLRRRRRGEFPECVLLIINVLSHRDVFSSLLCLCIRVENRLIQRNDDRSSGIVLTCALPWRE